MLEEICEGLAKVLNMILALLASDDNIINICRYVFVELRAQDCLDSSVKCAAHVAESLWHFDVTICVEGCCETGLLIVDLLHEDLVISREAIQHA